MLSEFRPLTHGFVLPEFPDRDPLGRGLRADKSRHFEASVLQRDRFRCQCCGFRSTHGMLAMATSDTPRMSTDFVTICRFCLHAAHLEIAVAARSGVLVWIPELTQIELNRGMPAILVSELSLRGRADPELKTIREIFLQRQHDAAEKLGVKNDTPLKDILVKFGVEGRANEELLSLFGDGLRILPTGKWIDAHGSSEFNVMPKVLSNWRAAFAHKTRGGMSEAFEASSLSWLNRLQASGG